MPDLEILLQQAGQEAIDAINEVAQSKSFSVLLPENILDSVEKVKIQMGLKSRKAIITHVISIYAQAINHAREQSDYVYVNSRGGIGHIQSIGMFTARAFPLTTNSHPRQEGPR